MRDPASPPPGTDAVLADALMSLAPVGVRIGHRIIAPDDEGRLLEAEWPAFAKAVPKVRRQSGAARAAARELLAAIGMHDVVLRKSASGAVVWPSCVVGSLAHDDDVAVAAIASSRDLTALGIDVEPAMPLPPEVVALVTTERERARYAPRIVESRLLFAIKEAVYKALNPTDGVFLEFHDVEVDLDGKSCRTRYGRCTKVAFITAPRVVAIAFA